MHAVIHIGRSNFRSKVPSKAGAAVWEVNDLTPRPNENLLKDLVQGKSYESLAQAIWSHQPNLRIATEKLAEFLTPLWPSSEGGSLLSVAIERALEKVDSALQRGENYHARVVGIYLYWLASCVADVARLNVNGFNASGERLPFRYFSEPLHLWVKNNSIQYIEASLVEEEPSEEMITGLRMHLVASITNPEDAGYLEMYAPKG
jgi:hypothetical protein